jgi:glycosyltransferase involved in cell wall biosynthesis
MMKILLLNNCKEMNGTHSVIYRLCKQLSLDGQEVYIYHFGGRASRFIPDILHYVKVIYLKDLIFKRAKKININVIFTPTLNTFLLATYLKDKFFNDAKILMGIYHPRQLLHRGCDTKAIVRVVDNIIGNIDKRNIMFMSEVVKRAHEEIFNISFSESEILPVPMDSVVFRERAMPKIKKIVSIGRLVDFKKYPYHVIEVIAELWQEGIEYYYDIYGEGEFSIELQALIDKLNVAPYVKLRGSISFDKINEVLKDAYLFIGMGTSIIQACSYGVPSFVAYDSYSLDEASTYGFYHDITGYEVGEIREDLTRVLLIDSLRSAAQLTPEEYTQLVHKAYQKADLFSSDKVTQKFYQIVNHASSTQKFSVGLIKLLYLFICRKCFRYFWAEKLIAK